MPYNSKSGFGFRVRGVDSHTVYLFWKTSGNISIRRLSRCSPGNIDSAFYHNICAPELHQVYLRGAGVS